MEEIISLYVGFIKKFENKLKGKYKIRGSLWSNYDTLPRTGEVENYTYDLHGIGCRIKSKEIVCEYDTLVDEGGNILFSVWKLFKFIETYPDLENMDMNQVYEYILTLMKNKIVSEFVIDDIKTNTYLVAVSYIDNLEIVE